MGKDPLTEGKDHPIEVEMNSKQVVKKRQPTLFALPGFDVSVNKIDKKTKKVITSFVRKDVVVGSEGVALPKFLSSYPCWGLPQRIQYTSRTGGSSNLVRNFKTVVYNVQCMLCTLFLTVTLLLTIGA